MSERNDQPTEQPTQRRKERALEDGQLAYSSELVGGLIILAAIGFFMLMGNWFFKALLDSIRESLTFFNPMIENPDSILISLRRHVTKVGVACMGLMLPLMAMVIIVGALQTRFNISLKPLNVKWNKLSPKSGLKRIFSTRSVNRGAVAILKTIAIIVAGYWITMAHFEQIATSGFSNYHHMLAIGTSIILQIGLVTALLMVVVGIGDLGFQIWKPNKDLMMPKPEIRDEQKDIEGSPELKARIRKIQNEMSQKRMAREVPEATVVITNPTHFAVALKYDPQVSAAPIVVAKGADLLAKKIINIAKSNGVAVIERKPVARFLYANVKIGHEIPLELYQAVAEILNYIQKLNRKSA